MLTIFFLVAVAASPCQAVLVDAQIGSGMREIRGTVTCLGASPGPLEVATYPRVLRRSSGLDDINRHWFYPSGFDAADMQIAVGGDLLETDGPWQALDAVDEARDVSVEFLTHVPRRNGTFGVSGSTAYLLGGWHPGFGRDGELEPSSIKYRIRLPPGIAAVVGGRVIGRDAARLVEGETFGRFVPVIAARRLDVATWDGALFVAPNPAALDEHEGDSAVGLRDLMAHRDAAAIEALRRTVVDGRAFYARSAPPPAEATLVVLAPLRERLVERFDGGLAVSDRAFHLLPYERFLKFHRLSVWREQLGLLAEAHCRRIASELPAELVSDLIGSSLRDRLAAERYGGKEYAPEVLETFAVIPEIDSLIFAPQVAFLTTYFNAIDETPRRRWRLDNFWHTRPRGKLLTEKLIDEIGAPDLHAIIDLYLDGDTPFFELAALYSDLDRLAFEGAWIGPYPRVDYALGEIQARDGGVEVMVEISGPDADRVREPITVEIEDDSGRIHRAQRVGPGPIRFEDAGPPSRVEPDPDGRLVELHHPPSEGPRFNNRRPHRWRFLLQNIASLIAATGGELRIAPSFSLRRIHDLRYRMGFFGLYSPAKLVGAFGLTYGFGEPVTALSTSQRVGGWLVYERLRREQDGALPGNQGSLQLFYSYGDRLSPYWSFEGKGLSVRLAGSYGVDETGQTFRAIQPGVSGLFILPLAFGHALVGRLRGDIQLGKPPPQDRLRLGDRYRGGRGFERQELDGPKPPEERARLEIPTDPEALIDPGGILYSIPTPSVLTADRRVIASVEYRHVLKGDGRTDLFGLLTWARFEGALFADAIYFPVSRPGCQRNIWYDVGYGVRIIADVMGISPAEIAIDIGVPLTLCSDRWPVTVYIGFDQSFSVF